MAKTATAPLPQVHSQAARNVRSRDSYRTASIEERTGVLEARWEETVPTLATKADISDLRSEIIKWVVGAGLALLAVTVALFTANTARIDKLDGKIDALAARQDARMDALDAKVDARFDKLDAKIDARFDVLLSRQAELDAKLDARFDAIMAELREQRGK